MTNEEKRILSLSQRLTTWFSTKLFYSIGKSHQRKWPVKRGEVYFVDLGHNIGSEENKIRPVVVIQANSYNFSSSVFICAIISSSTVSIPDIQVPISGTYAYIDERGTSKTLHGAVDLGQIKTVAKERIKTPVICTLSRVEMEELDKKLLNALGLKGMISTRDNTIASLQGKIDYLQKQLKAVDNKSLE